VCSEDARRVFHAPSLLGRQKPMQFKWEVKKMSAMDDRLAGFRQAESEGPEKVAMLRKAFGEQVYKQVQTHKKENYA